MIIFFIVLIIVFVIVFVIGFLICMVYDLSNEFDNPQLWGLVSGITLAVIAAIIMGFMILTNELDANSRVASMNAEAEILQYQLEQISDGEYIIEEYEVYEDVVTHNAEVAVCRERSQSIAYNWFYPDEYLQMQYILIPA